jgi:hypothetical protein
MPNYVLSIGTMKVDFDGAGKVVEEDQPEFIYRMTTAMRGTSTQDGLLNL